MNPLFLIIGTAMVGLYMAWNIGANDVANSMGCAVGSRAISVRQAILAAGIFEFAGAILVGAHVTDTVRKGIVDPAALAAIPGLQPGDAAAILLLGMGASLIAAAIILHLATGLGMPVSTTHSIVGAIAGFGIAAAGWRVVDWSKMGQIVASWFLSPLAGGALGYLIFSLISRLILRKERPAQSAVSVTPFFVFYLFAVVCLCLIYKGLQHLVGHVAWLTPGCSIFLALAVSAVAALAARILLARAMRRRSEAPIGEQLAAVEKSFAPLLMVASCAVSFSHGANDVANAVGPLAAIVDIVQTGAVKMRVAVPLWILLIGGSGIVLGLATFGGRVMRTIGEKITEITPSRGVAASLATTTTVLVCTRLTLPVSTSHTLVGAIIGIGFARGLASVDRQVTRDIFSAWFLTVPISALVAAILFLAGKLFFFDLLKQTLLRQAAG